MASDTVLFSEQEWLEALTAAGMSPDDANALSSRLVAAQSPSSNQGTVGVPPVVYVCLAELSSDARARVRAVLATLSPEAVDALCRIEPRLRVLRPAGS